VTLTPAGSIVPCRSAGFPAGASLVRARTRPPRISSGRRRSIRLGFRRGRHSGLRRSRVEQPATVGAGTERLTSPNRRVHLRRKPQMASAAIPFSYRDDHGAAPRPTESVVRGEEGFRDRVPECRAAFLEGGPVDPRVFRGELIVDRAEVGQCADGPIHCSPMRASSLPARAGAPRRRRPRRSSRRRGR